MTADDHIGERAEIYALGALDDPERAAVDAHVRTCATCAARLGEAEAFIAQTVIERSPSAALDRRVHAAFVPRSSSVRALAPLVAAAFVLGLLPSLWFGFVQRPAAPFDADHDRAVAALVTSHFLHAQFRPLAPDAPKAKLIYGRTAPWRFFVAQTTHPYAVEERDASGTVLLGRLHISGDAAELFVAKTSARTFLLTEGGRPVARVTIP